MHELHRSRRNKVGTMEKLLQCRAVRCAFVMASTRFKLLYCCNLAKYRLEKRHLTSKWFMFNVLWKRSPIAPASFFTSISPQQLNWWMKTVVSVRNIHSVHCLILDTQIHLCMVICRRSSDEPNHWLGSKHVHIIKVKDNEGQINQGQWDPITFFTKHFFLCTERPGLSWTHWYFFMCPFKQTLDQALNRFGYNEKLVIDFNW